MHILYFCNENYASSYNAYKLAKIFTKRKHKVSLIVTTDFNIPVKDDLIDIYAIDYASYMFDSVKLDNVDVVLGYSQSMAPFIAEYKKHYHIRGYCIFFDFPVGITDGKDIDNYDFNYSQKFYYWINCALELDGIIFTNYYFADQFFKRYKRTTHVVHFPAIFEDEDFRYADKTLEYIVGSSSVYKYKGIHLLVSALDSLPYDYIHLYSKFDPKYLDSLRISCEVQNNSFKFYKNVKPTMRAEFIYNAKMLIYPQTIEWLGMGSVLDAISLKTPVICYDSPVAKELFKDSIIYVKKGSIKYLRKKIKLLYKDKDWYDEMVKRGYELYQEQYTKEKAIDNLLGVFNE